MNLKSIFQKFRDHKELKDEHALLSPSNYRWLGYDDDRFKDFITSSQAAVIGTKKHALAAMCIELGQNLPRSKKTLCNYVNDAIAFKMKPEVTLVYSQNCFGTADAIVLDEKNNLLRVHDLKTGVMPAKMDQLRIYAALFCLEYGYSPYNLEFELRIYQNDEIVVEKPCSDDIQTVMDIIVQRDAEICAMNEV